MQHTPMQNATKITVGRETFIDTYDHKGDYHIRAQTSVVAFPEWIDFMIPKTVPKQPEYDIEKDTAVKDNALWMERYRIHDALKVAIDWKTHMESVIETELMATAYDNTYICLCPENVNQSHIKAELSISANELNNAKKTHSRLSHAINVLRNRKKEIERYLSLP